MVWSEKGEKLINAIFLKKTLPGECKCLNFMYEKENSIQHEKFSGHRRPITLSTVLVLVVSHMNVCIVHCVEMLFSILYIYGPIA